MTRSHPCMERLMVYYTVFWAYLSSWLVFVFIPLAAIAAAAKASFILVWAAYEKDLDRMTKP